MLGRQLGTGQAALQWHSAAMATPAAQAGCSSALPARTPNPVGRHSIHLAPDPDLSRFGPRVRFEDGHGDRLSLPLH